MESTARPREQIVEIPEMVQGRKCGARRISNDPALEQVELGQFASPADVVEAALSRMMSPTFPAGELDKLLAEGEASFAGGKGRSADEFFDDLRSSSRAHGGGPA